MLARTICAVSILLVIVVQYAYAVSEKLSTYTGWGAKHNVAALAAKERKCTCACGKGVDIYFINKYKKDEDRDRACDARV